MPPDAALGMAMVALCAGAIAAFVVIVSRRRRQAAEAVDALAWATARIDTLTGTTFDTVRYRGEVPQLVFEGDLTQVMTVDRLPTVVRGASILRAGQPGHRQALAELRGETVYVARFEAEGELVLEFGAGSLVIEPSSPV